VPQKSKLLTAKDETYKKGALFIDKAILPAIKSIIEKANEELEKRGIVVAAEINWMISEIKKEDETNGKD
jgi:hypothetical protein